MSQENVEMVRRAYEAFNRGDLDGMVTDYAPTFEYVTTGTIPGVGGMYRGAEGWLEFMRWFWSEFETPRVEIRELIEARDDVLASLTLRGVESRVAWRPVGTYGTSGPCSTARSCAGRDSRADSRPSNSPGCRSSAVTWRVDHRASAPRSRRPSPEFGDRHQHLAALADDLQVGLDVLLEEVDRDADRGCGLVAISNTAPMMSAPVDNSPTRKDRHA
jgi:SnoaL-like domain